MEKAAADRRKQSPPRSEDDFRSLADQAPMFLWAIDTELNLIYANRKTLAYAGLKRIEDYSREEWLRITHPDDYDYMLRTSQDGIANCKAYSMELRLREAKTGDYHWYAVMSRPFFPGDGKFGGFVGSAVNIDKLKAAEVELADSEKEFSQIFNQTSVGISKTDFKGQYVLVNKRYAEIVGRKKSELMRGSIRDTTHPDDYSDILAVRRRVRKTNGNTDVERRYVRPDGSVVWTSLSSTVMTDAKGIPKYMLSMAQDITERKLAQERLNEREKRLHAIVNQTTAGIMQTDLEGNFTYVNPGFSQIVGREPDELYKLNVADITHSEDVADNMRQLRRLIKTGDDFIIRKRYLRPDGSFVWVRNNVSALKDEDGKVVSVLAVSVNVHEQEEAAKALQASEEKFRLATEAGKVGTWEWDIISDRTTWSDELHNIYGIEVGNFNGGFESDLNLIHPDDKDMVGSVIRKTIRSGTDFELEFRIFRSDGKIRWIVERGRVQRDAEGKAFRISGTRNDITARKLVQEQLRQSESELRFMAESMPQKVFAANPDGSIDYINPQWTGFTGLSIREIIKNGWNPLIHPDDTKENRRRWKASLRSGKPFEFEHRLRRADGVYRWHITRAQAMRDIDGNITRWFGSVTDIDEIKNTIRRKNELELTTVALEKQRTQLMMLNKAKDEFISLASHQLRTPASGVKQLLGMLIEGYAGELDEQQRSLIERANESNERQILVINDLLRVAQVDAGKVQLHRDNVNIVALIQDVLDSQIGIFADRAQKIVFNHDKAKVLAYIDSRRVRMVLENLFDNASKYTYPRKSIRVNLTKTQDEILVAIQDEGVGIRKKDIPKLFHKFSRFDNPLSVKVGGTGLGLYWANKIVELHGGRIDVVSKYKKGTTFTIVLPIRKAAGQPPLKEKLELIPNLSQKPGEQI